MLAAVRGNENRMASYEEQTVGENSTIRKSHISTPSPAHQLSDPETTFPSIRLPFTAPVATSLPAYPQPHEPTCTCEFEPGPYFSNCLKIFTRSAIFTTVFWLDKPLPCSNEITIAIIAVMEI
jgi:hypothetical protein